MINHQISGSLSQWRVEDPKSREERWRGYIAARLSYPNEEREKFPFLVHQSIKGVDDLWSRYIYLNDAGQWQAKFVMISSEDRAKELMAAMVKPQFKDFVELLGPTVPEDFKMPKIKRSRANKGKEADEDQDEFALSEV